MEIKNISNIQPSFVKMKDGTIAAFMREITVFLNELERLIQKIWV
jgi:hypothetical protein